MIEPPGEVKPESEVYYLLARRLGFDDDALAGRIPGMGDAAIESFLESKLAPFEGMTLERLREGPILPPGHQEVAFSDFVFPTPSGRIELCSEDAAALWGVAAVPSYSEPVESAGPRFPLYFMTPNTKNRIHSQFNNLRMIQQFGDRPFVLMNPDDAAARGIDDGGLVEIFNDRGSLKLEARLENGLKAGCVAVTNGWWISEGGTVNFCSYGRETDMGYGAAFHDNMVEVRRIAGD
jgi:anaerobic selenocysteine-containing dehydrogenase